MIIYSFLAPSRVAFDNLKHLEQGRPRLQSVGFRKHDGYLLWKEDQLIRLLFGCFGLNAFMQFGAHCT